MIVITTQIQHVPGRGVSMASVAEYIKPTQIESQFANAINLAIAAVNELLLKSKGNGFILEGGEAMTATVKKHMEEKGVQLTGTPIDAIFKRHEV